MSTTPTPAHTGFVLVTTNASPNDRAAIPASAALSLLQSQYGERAGLEAFLNLLTGAAKCASVAGPHMLEWSGAPIPPPVTTPNAALPPLDPGAPKRAMLIEINVAADFERRLDNQWMVEREIQADRWKWDWKESA